MNLDKNKLLNKIGNWIVSKINKIELILGLVIILSILIRIITNYSMSVFISIPISILSIVYYFCAYSNTEDKDIGRRIIFANYIYWWSCSVVLIGILSGLENYPVSKTLLQVGCISSIILIMIMLFVNSKKSELKLFKPRMVKRLLILFVISIILLSIPTEKLTTLKIINKIEQVDSD